MQLWTAIDGAAKDNPAPILIYLESSLVIRAIRDYFSPDIGEILIDTDDIADQATAFMSVVMPDNVDRVKRYRDDVPLFSRFQIEHQIETAYSRTVELPSGGSIVIDHTEALVAVDVNSARSTRGADIEETATRTNQEAADEVARQLRLRDLGGLIVIDFIDMEDTKNQRSVENRLRDALHFDRARVQMGKISRFGLMELSRQRLRPALNEGSHITCPRCNGTGVIRDAESSALQVLRLLQEEAMKENTAAVHAQVPVDVATFLLNEKRSDITKIEARLKVNLILIPNRHLETPHHHIERLRHDDPRLEDIKTSFDMVDAPSTDMSWAPKEQEVKAKPEALVKGITPSQPAPVSSTPAKKAAAAATESSPGLFKRLMGWLTGGSSEEKKVEEAPKPSEARGERGRHGQGNRGNGNRGGQHRGRRPDNRNEARPGTEASTDGDNRRPPREDATGAGRTAGAEQSDEGSRQGGRHPRGRGRPRRDEGDGRQEGAEGTQAVQAAAGAQANGAPQAPRQSQGPRTEAAHAAQTDDQLQLQNGPEGQLGSEDDNSGDPERKRRRRRSRRGKRGQDEGSGFENEDGSPSLQQAAPHAQADAVAMTPAAAPLQTHVAPTYVAPASQAYVAPVQAAAPVAVPAAQPTAAPSAYVAPAAPAAYVNVTSAAEPVAHAAAPVTTPVTVNVAAAAPATESATPAAAAPAAVAVTPVAVAAAPVAVAVAAAPVAVAVAVAPVAASVAPATEAPVAVAPASVSVAAPAPVVQAAPAPAPAADLATLHAIVNAAGLQWIESDPARVAQPLAQQPTVSIKLGRERKPAVVISSEPLVQVETRA
jgi:ribonuclease E